MNWEGIGAIGQAISALALFGVFIQVRHAQEQARRALSQARSEAFRDNMALQCDERISQIMVKAQNALGAAPAPVLAEFTNVMEGLGLTRAEALVMAYVQFMHWNYRVQVMPYADELSAIERAQFDTPIRSLYGSPGVGSIFYEAFIKTQAHPDAVRYVENLLAQPNSTPK